MEGRLTGLDALRGIAALIVFLGHTGARSGLYSIPGGYVAVDFFFMLSGYVMARTYEHRMGNDLGVLAFTWKRYRRLWPMMALGTILIAPVALHWPNGWIDLALNLLLLPTFTYLMAYPANHPAWSILFELIANACHALFLWRIRLAAMIGALVLVCGTQWLLVGTYDLGPRGAELPMGVARVLLPYCIGIWLWRTLRDRPAVRIPPLVTALIFIAAIAVDLPGIMFVLIVCPLLIIGGLNWRAGELGALAGAVSFPLYAIHFPLLRVYLTAGVPVWLGAMLTFALALILAVAPSVWRSRLVERPALERAPARLPADAPGSGPA